MAGRIAYFGNIVTQGLVLDLDAAKRDSYPGSGTAWRDISGNQNNGTLVNGPTYSSANGGSFIFNSINNYVQTAYTTALTDFTVCAWFNPKPTQPGSSRIVDKDYMGGFWMGKNPSGLANSWGGGVRESPPPYGRYIILAADQWHYIVSRRAGTTHTILGDGITNTVSGTVSSTALNTTSLRLAVEQITPNTAWFNGNIAQVQIYNRALTDAEILQNYNATRGRFGL